MFGWPTLDTTPPEALRRHTANKSTMGEVISEARALLLFVKYRRMQDAYQLNLHAWTDCAVKVPAWCP